MIWAGTEKPQESGDLNPGNMQFISTRQGSHTLTAWDGPEFLSAVMVSDIASLWEKFDEFDKSKLHRIKIFSLYVLQLNKII